jgi:hypothetical protein
MNINRIWAMPHGNTFTIKPIRELIQKYIEPSSLIVDPFSNKVPYKEHLKKNQTLITNDLNPEFKTTFNLDALKFLKQLESDSCDLLFYDPPFSITQASQLYKSYGKEKLEIHVSNMKYWAECKNESARALKKDGVVISCGWSSNGLGKGRGFEMIEILLVPHGGSKNDTIVTVERKI